LIFKPTMQSIWYDCNGCVFINMKFCFRGLLEYPSARVAGTGGRRIACCSQFRRLLPSFILVPFVASPQRLNDANDSPFKMQNCPPTWESHNWGLQCGRVFLCLYKIGNGLKPLLTLLDICITAELSLCTPSNDEVFLTG